MTNHNLKAVINIIGLRLATALDCFSDNDIETAKKKVECAHTLVTDSLYKGVSDMMKNIEKSKSSESLSTLKRFSDTLIERAGGRTVSREYGEGFSDCFKMVVQIVEEMRDEIVAGDKND